MRLYGAILALAAMFVYGCDHKGPSEPPPASVAPTAANSPAGTTTPAPPTQTKTAQDVTKPTDITPADTTPQKTDAIPANLKTAGYEYYGVGHSAPIDYELSGDGVTGVTTGSQTTVLKEIKDGKAFFTQTRTGGLSILGSDDLSLDQEGVHVVSSSVETVQPGNLEFPADITPGKTWKSHDKISQAGSEFDVTTDYTIKGITTVSTKRGQLEAVRITSIGQGTQNGHKLRMETDSYYAKGIGLAKAVIKTTSDGGKVSSITQQLAN